jgi:hypothetical protein
MWPTDIERVRYFNRNGHAAYLEWLCEKTGMPFKAEMMRVRTRPEIDDLFKPGWVNVAEEVLSTHTDFADSAYPPYTNEDPVDLEPEPYVDPRWDALIEKMSPEPEPTSGGADHGDGRLLLIHRARTAGGVQAQGNYHSRNQGGGRNETTAS